MEVILGGIFLIVGFFIVLNNKAGINIIEVIRTLRSDSSSKDKKKMIKGMLEGGTANLEANYEKEKERLEKKYQNKD